MQNPAASTDEQGFDVDAEFRTLQIFEVWKLMALTG